MTEKEMRLKEDREKQVVKEALKEGIQDWMDKQFASLGRWTFRGMCAISFAVVIYLWLSTHGWKAPQVTP